MLYIDDSQKEIAIRVVKIESIEFLNSYDHISSNTNLSNNYYILNIVTKSHERDWKFKTAEERDKVFTELIQLSNRAPSQNSLF